MIRFCPSCADILQLVKHTDANGDYWQWECPEQDWFEPAPEPEEDEESSE